MNKFNLFFNLFDNCAMRFSRFPEVIVDNAFLAAMMILPTWAMMGVFLMTRCGFIVASVVTALGLLVALVILWIVEDFFKKVTAYRHNAAFGVLLHRLGDPS
ncbi:MAG: hypothetical protein ABH826_02400 [Patescibacteria group bacterium]|nr:hypothetical protein [Patescibacteria group bacterium]